MFVHALCLLSLPVLAAAAAHAGVPHSHRAAKRLPSTWYHADDHPVQSLFKRGGSNTDGVAYPGIGSPTWSSAYPVSTPDSSALPKEWVDALNAAVNAGSIPNFAPSNNVPNQNPTYPAGLDPLGSEVCSATYKCRNPGDIWDAPTGFFGTGFDDGPQPASSVLYQFLQEKNEPSTHFMIGVNILQNAALFDQAVNTLQADIAVHTWTHPYMTTLSNLDVVAQLGWTMEIIHNSTGGRLPKFWRPPYGDSDNRVRAIAKEVFGLTTIIWNQDTEDWSIATGGTTSQAVNASLTKWLTGPKSPGLIILEHELTPQTVQAFMDAYPVIKANGWNMQSVTRLGDVSAYQNSDGPTSPVAPADIIASGNSSISAAPSSQSSASVSPSAKPPPTSASPSGIKAGSSPINTPSASPSTAAQTNGDVSFGPNGMSLALAAVLSMAMTAARLL